jgi:hypothetical protein
LQNPRNIILFQPRSHTMGQGWFESGMSGLGRLRDFLQESWRYGSMATVFFTAALLGFPAPSHAQHLLAAAPIVDDASAASAPAAPSALPSTIVIGFMGGMVKRNEPNRSEVQLAERLRELYPNAAYVDTFKNADWKDARERILKVLDVDKNGKLSLEEKQHARIIIFGHSWGASATVTLARELGNMGIPVMLTVQVDSVQKMGQKDDVIPPNVAEAINFFQPDGFLHGRKLIRAEDPAKTKILGNQEFSYKHVSLSCKGYPWQQRLFAKEHMYIECDPEVWGQIESLIRSRLPQAQAQTSTQPIQNQAK